MSRDSFFLMLAVLGVVAGVAMFALRAPIRHAVGHDA
jgi:hypothetical protein